MKKPRPKDRKNRERKAKKAAKRKKTRAVAMKRERVLVEKMNKMSDEELQAFLGMDDKEFEVWSEGDDDQNEPGWD